MSKQLGIPQTLSDAGVAKSDYDRSKAHIIKSAVNDACTVTNPRDIDSIAVETILKGIEQFK